MRQPTFAIAALAALGLALAPAAAEAKRKPKPASAKVWPTKAPKLIVAISVDQYSADLFAQYRRSYVAGLARLQQGAVFPQGFQSHAATETCPGHSTLMTGDHPARTGIIANNWYAARPGKPLAKIYCLEDVANPASKPEKPVVTTANLLVPTLGDRVKALDPASRNVAVSGKDRAAVMMGGHALDAVYWFDGMTVATLPGRALSPAAVTENVATATLVKAGAPAMAVPASCAARNVAVPVKDFTIGTSTFAAAPDKPGAFRATPWLDQVTADLALKVVDEMKLGAGASPDVLSVSFSANDYIGHAFGTEGVEMCIQQDALDRTVGTLLSGLDARGIDYVVVLSADHGGFDAPERLDMQGYPSAQRALKALTPKMLSDVVGAATGVATSGRLIDGDGAGGDYYVARDLAPDARTKVIAALVATLKANPQVALVVTADELAAVPLPTGSPQDWTLAERARESFYAPRSGDVIALLKRGVSGVVDPAPGYTATHGSPWDYDRRVPMLFWRKGMTGFEQPAPVETVDIAPTLAALLGVKLAPGEVDGRCLDLDAGAADSCAVQ